MKVIFLFFSVSFYFPYLLLIRIMYEQMLKFNLYDDADKIEVVLKSGIQKNLAEGAQLLVKWDLEAENIFLQTLRN